MKTGNARFRVGQVIRHRLFEYRGVVFDVDPVFLGTEEWYEQMARSRPPKDEPWYHVLVHDAGHTTYVAEQNMAEEPDPEPIRHPQIGELFEGWDGEAYRPAGRRN